MPVRPRHSIVRGIGLEPRSEASLVNLFADLPRGFVYVLLDQNEAVLADNAVERPGWVINVFVIHDDGTHVTLDLDLESTVDKLIKEGSRQACRGGGILHQGQLVEVEHAVLRRDLVRGSILMAHPH